MADVKIGVDADDATRNIEELQAVFDRFAAASEKQTTTWTGVRDEVDALVGSVDDLHGTMNEVATLMSGLVANQEKFDQGTERASRRWQQLARHTQNAAGHIKGATESLLKWAGISGLVMGAAGFGASHLIFDFANSVSAKRSTAMGLNTTYGGLASARTNYARFGDADSVLGNIASAQQDPSKRLAFANLGISNFADRDSADLLKDVLKRTKDRLDEAHARGQPLAQTARNLHLDDLFSMGDLQRIQRDSREEVYGQADRIGKDRGGLDLAPDVQRKWQELSTQLAKAGTAIETVLVNRLVALEPGLQKLSESFTKVAQTLLAKDGPAAQWLGEIDTGLEWLAKKLGDPQTQKDLGDFVTELGRAANYVLDMSKKALGLLHWLAKLTGEDATSSNTDAAGGVTGLTGDAGINLRGGTGGGLGGRGYAHNRDAGAHSANRGRFGYHGTPQKGAWWTDERIRHAYDKLTAGGLSPREAEGQIARMVYVEAGSGPTAGNSIGGGHYGIFQADRARQRDFGGSSNFDDQLDAIVKEKKTTEAASHRAGLAAKDDFEAARAASMFERAEGYAQRRDGTDNFTAKTQAGIPKIHDIVTNRGAKPVATAPVKVTVNRATGANPTTAVAATAAAP